MFPTLDAVFWFFFVGGGVGCQASAKHGGAVMMVSTAIRLKKWKNIMRMPSDGKLLILLNKEDMQQ